MRAGSLVAVLVVVCLLVGLSGYGRAAPLADDDRRAVSKALSAMGLLWVRDDRGGEAFGCEPVRHSITPAARDGVAVIARIAARDGAALHQPEGPDSAVPMRDLVGAELHILDVCFGRPGTPGEGWRHAYAALVDARCPQRPAAKVLRYCGVAPKGGW